MYHDYQPFPCFHCQPHSYIRMVQHLIERCLILRMNRDQCIKVLAEHARVQPLVTLTVWRELLKENRHFFRAYYGGVFPRRFRDFGGICRRPFRGKMYRRKTKFARKESWR